MNTFKKHSEIIQKLKMNFVLIVENLHVVGTVLSMNHNGWRYAPVPCTKNEFINLKNNLDMKNEQSNDRLLCALCGSDKNVEFVKITDCNLCEKCNNELADSFECAMKMDRSDDPEL